MTSNCNCFNASSNDAEKECHGSDGRDDINLKKLYSIAKKSYRDQAIWFLDSFTKCHHDLHSSEIVFKIHKKCLEYNNDGDDNDKDNVKKEGKIRLINEIDSHHILEFIGKPVTQSAFRNYFLKIDPTFKVTMAIPLVILFFFYFDVDWKKLIVNTSQTHYDGIEIDNAKEALYRAQNKLQSTINAEQKSTQEAKEADDAMYNSQKQQDILSKAIIDCRIEEEGFAKTKKQAEDSLEYVMKQESDTKEKKQSLEQIINNESNGIVTRNKAKAELQIIEHEDPLPLRKARIKNENAVKKLKISTNASKNARIAAENAKERAEKAMVDAKLAKEKAVEAATNAEATISKAREAIDYLKVLVDEMMENQIIPWGSLFYIDREVREAEKFLPKEKLRRLKKAAEEMKRRISIHSQSSRRSNETDMCNLPISLSSNFS
jgi:hypothetical protein